MSAKNQILLNTYSESAEKQFNALDTRLSTMERSFQSRMDGKTTGGLVGSLIGTLFWLAAYIVGAFYVRNHIENIPFLSTVIVTMLLMAFMLLDNILNFSYYGRIDGYRNAISHLRDRIASGKKAMVEEQLAFKKAQAQGWQYSLKAKPSISDEALSIEAATSRLVGLKTGFLPNVKNFFFFVAVILITLAGCMALFPIGDQIMLGISGEELSNGTLEVLNIIALVLIEIAEIILAKMLWSRTDCSVNNVTLLITALGPLAYLALVALATAIVMLVIGIVQLVLYVLGVVIVGAIAFACLCGG